MKKLRFILLPLVAVRAMALSWETTTGEFTPDGTQRSVTAVFPFKNTGDKPARITSVAPNCDCLTPKLEKMLYLPGESGELRVEFSLGGRTGRQEKTVAVTADDEPGSPTVLKLIVDIPEPVAIRPRFVFWRVDGPAEEKSVEIVLADPGRASLSDIQSIEPSFDVRLEAGNKPGRHRMVIRPVDTSKLAQSPIRLTAIMDGHPKVFVVIAAVK